MKGKGEMLVLAISTKGHEFFYDARTAHKVSKAAAEKIRDICNEYKFRLKDGETWFLHEVDQYDTAYEYAQFQKFTIRNGIVKAHSNL